MSAGNCLSYSFVVVMKQMCLLPKVVLGRRDVLGCAKHIQGAGSVLLPGKQAPLGVCLIWCYEHKRLCKWTENKFF